jgi:cytosine deaminase
LVSLDYFLQPEAEPLADWFAEYGGILGGVAYMNPDIDRQLERVFQLAAERGLNLDFHVDESLDPQQTTLRHVAEMALKQQFSGDIVCGHCCSLSVQSPAAIAQTLQAVKAAEIGIVSLPLCNLYLQDRQPGRMPRLRGVTLLHELKQAGIPVAVASDNCRDPFYAYGDHDGWDVFNLSVRIGHLDRPFGDWPRANTWTAADLMGLAAGRISEGQPADLILFKARNLNELLSRSQHDRVVLRQGQPIDTTLPDYAELDDLMPLELR